MNRNNLLKICQKREEKGRTFNIYKSDILIKNNIYKSDQQNQKKKM